MESRIDKSMKEVLKMKERANNDFLNSGFESYTEYIEKRTTDTIKKYGIKIRSELLPKIWTGE